MLFNNDNTGTLSLMLGMFILICTGVVLSSLLDLRLGFSRRASLLKSEIKQGEVQLDDLKKTHRKVSMKLYEQEPKRTTAYSRRVMLQSQMVQLGERRSSLTNAREDLQNSIPILQEEFSLYRKQYRKIIRDAAIGMSLGTLTTLGGREFHQSFITRVTDIGLEIRHEHGAARIKASDLDVSLQEKFQWDYAYRHY